MRLGSSAPRASAAATPRAAAGRLARDGRPGGRCGRPPRRLRLVRPGGRLALVRQVPGRVLLWRGLPAGALGGAPGGLPAAPARRPGAAPAGRIVGRGKGSGRGGAQRRASGVAEPLRHALGRVDACGARWEGRGLSMAPARQSRPTAREAAMRARALFESPKRSRAWAGHIERCPGGGRLVCEGLLGRSAAQEQRGFCQLEYAGMLFLHVCRTAPTPSELGKHQ